MGIFSKLAFWKRDDDFSFDDIAKKELGSEFGSGQPVQDNLGLEEKSPFSTSTTSTTDFSPNPAPTTPPSSTFPQQSAPPPVVPQQPTGNQEKDFELISSKLDTIKALLGSLDQRIANLEIVAGVEKKEKLW